MAKININFKGKTYSIDEAVLDNVVSHLHCVFEQLEKGASVAAKAAGLYETGTDNMTKSWQELLDCGYIVVNDGECYSGVDDRFFSSYASALYGDLHLPADGSVTSIGSSAFTDGYNLTSITIPDSVTSIGDYAFDYCSSLTDLTIGDSVTTIGSGAFENCSSLTSVTIGDSVTSIGERAFEHCTSLTTVTFSGTAAQWSAIELGRAWCPTVDYIQCSDGRLYACKGWYIRETTDTTAGLYEHGTSNMVKSWNDVLADGDLIGDYPNVDGDLVLPADGSITTIYPHMFKYSALKSIIMPDSITSIGNNACDSCRTLESVVIGSGVKSIESQAFADCTTLTSITFNGTVAQWNAIEKCIEDEFYKWNYNTPATYVQCSDGTVDL